MYTKYNLIKLDLKIRDLFGLTQSTADISSRLLFFPAVMSTRFLCDVDVVVYLVLSRENYSPQDLQ